MKSFATTLMGAALAALLAFNVALGADASKSAALVRAMRSDEIAVATVKHAFLSGAMVERFGKTRDSCVERVSYTDFTGAWARVVDSVLSPSEIDTSLAFFQSDAGVKYVEGLVRRLRARQGKDSSLPEVSGSEEISKPQLAAIADFTSTAVGRKVLGKDLTMSPAAVALGSDMTQKIAGLCRR
jgi:hypothetical protein